MIETLSSEEKMIAREHGVWLGGRVQPGMCRVISPQHSTHQKDLGLSEPTGVLNL